MTDYRVRWEIDIEADTPEEAARQALEIQRNPQSIATVFQVHGKEGFNVLDESTTVDFDPHFD